MLGERRLEEGVAARPGDLAGGHHLVDLADGGGREGAGEARGRARGEGELDRVGEPLVAAAVIAERQHQPVLVLDHLGRRVEPEPLLIAAEIGDGDEQVERLAVGQQPLAGGRMRHRVECVEDRVEQPLAPERRLEPAPAHEPLELGAHLVARARLDGLVDRLAAMRDHPGDRDRPDLGEAMRGGVFGIEQRLDIGVAHPQFGQRIERLASGDRLREEHRVDPARARARDDVDEHAQPDAGGVLDFLEQRAIDALAAAVGGFAIARGAAGAGRGADLLGDAMHVDREADPAIADER